MTRATTRYPNRIKEIIKHRGYNIGEVAGELGIPSRTMTNYLQGVTAMPRRYVEQLSHLLGCSVDELLGLPTVPENIAKYCIATFRAISCLFREGNPHWMHCKILYTL